MKQQKSKSMKKSMILVSMILFCAVSVFAQVSINQDGSLPSTSAMLDVQSTSSGLLIPRMSDLQRDAISSPENGLMVYVTTDNRFYYYDGTAWELSSGGNDADWTISGSNMYSIVSGNVGIGTTTPSERLEVSGNIKLSSELILSETMDQIKFTGNTDQWWLMSKGAPTDDLALALYSPSDDGGIQSGWNFYVRENGKVYMSNSLGIGTSSPDASAILEMESTNKGFLPPRMTETEIGNIISPANGLMVFCTTDNKPYVYVSTYNEWHEIKYDTGVIGGYFNCGNTLTDSRDGKTYSTVQIGTQCWMSENLNVGIRIDAGDYPADDGIEEKYCYDDTESNCDNSGGLYNWDEAMQYETTSGAQGICPTGWHLPTDDEYKTLEIHLGMSSSVVDNSGFRGTDQGSQLAGDAPFWTNGLLDQNANFGTSGFSVLPTGMGDPGGAFYDMDEDGFLWTSSGDGYNAWSRHLYYNSSDISRFHEDASVYIAIRCVR